MTSVSVIRLSLCQERGYNPLGDGRSASCCCVSVILSFCHSVILVILVILPFCLCHCLCVSVSVSVSLCLCVCLPSPVSVSRLPSPVSLSVPLSCCHLFCAYPPLPLQSRFLALSAYHQSLAHSLGALEKHVQLSREDLRASQAHVQFVADVRDALELPRVSLGPPKRQKVEQDAGAAETSAAVGDEAGCGSAGASHRSGAVPTPHRQARHCASLALCIAGSQHCADASPTAVASVSPACLLDGVRAARAESSSSGAADELLVPPTPTLATEARRTVVPVRRDLVQPFDWACSPLLVVPSYRFHPHFANAPSLSAVSSRFVHRLDPFKTLCRDELATGKCDSDKCRFQHRADYLLSDEAVEAQVLAAAVELDVPVQVHAEAGVGAGADVSEASGVGSGAAAAAAVSSTGDHDGSGAAGSNTKVDNATGLPVDKKSTNCEANGAGVPDVVEADDDRFDDDDDDDDDGVGGGGGDSDGDDVDDDNGAYDSEFSDGFDASPLDYVTAAEAEVHGVAALENAVDVLSQIRFHLAQAEDRAAHAVLSKAFDTAIGGLDGGAVDAKPPSAAFGDVWDPAGWAAALRRDGTSAAATASFDVLDAALPFTDAVLSAVNPLHEVQWSTEVAAASVSASAFASAPSAAADCGATAAGSTGDVPVVATASVSDADSDVGAGTPLLSSDAASNDSDGDEEQTEPFQAMLKSVLASRAVTERVSAPLPEFFEVPAAAAAPPRDPSLPVRLRPGSAHFGRDGDGDDDDDFDDDDDDDDDDDGDDVGADDERDARRAHDSGGVAAVAADTTPQRLLSTDPVSLVWMCVTHLVGPRPTRVKRKFLEHRAADARWARSATDALVRTPHPACCALSARLRFTLIDGLCATPPGCDVRAWCGSCGCVGQHA